MTGQRVQAPGRGGELAARFVDDYLPGWFDVALPEDNGPVPVIEDLADRGAPKTTLRLRTSRHAGISSRPRLPTSTTVRFGRMTGWHRPARSRAICGAQNPHIHMLETGLQAFEMSGVDVWAEQVPELVEASHGRFSGAELWN